MSAYGRIDMKSVFYFIAVLAVLSANAIFGGEADHAECVQIYVSPVYTDQPDGSMEKPFNSLVDARNYIRYINDRGNDRDIIVWLRGGVYRPDKTIEFTNDYFSKGEVNISFKAHAGQRPVISGGREITGWQQDEDGVWKAKAQFNFRQLYVNGKAAVRARTPNDSYFKLKKWDTENKVILAEPDIDIPEMVDAGGVEFRMQHVWADTNLRLESIRKNDSMTRIIAKEPERTLLFERSHPKKKKGLAFHFENNRSFLDRPGEFYLDLAKRTVYYIPREGEDMTKAVVEAPKLETLLAVTGTLDEPVKNLWFEGITFRCTTWLKVDESGLLTLQAGMYNISATPDNIQHAKRPPAAVYVAAAEGVTFERNIIMNTGASGMDLHYGTSHCNIRGNVFKNTAGNGIQHAIFSKPEVEIHVAYNPQDPREICRYDKIENNYFDNIAWYYYGSVAITSGYPMGIEIEHNEVTNTSYTGISVGWGWTSMPNAMRQNKIRYNHIHHVMTMLGDGGAIYTLSPQPDSEMAYNYIHDVAPGQDVVHGRVKGIYLDERTDGYVVHHNAVYDAPYKYFRHRVGPNNIFHNNHRQLDEGIPEFDNMHLDELKSQAGLEPAYKDIKGLL